MVVAAFLLAAGLVVAALIAVRGIEYVKGYESSRLEVTGSADRPVVSDQVKWTGSFSRRVDASGLGDGYRRMTADLDAVVDVLEDAGFERDDLSIQPVSVSAVYRECYNAGADCVREVIGYELYQWFTLTSDQVQAVTTLAQDAQPFVDAGLTYQTTSLEYYYSGLSDLRPELLAEAIRDAQSRAQAVAEATGARVGNLRSADSGVFQVTQLNSTEVASYGMYDTSTIEKRVTAVVHASFELR
ncbi:MAG TPA: SIMPL domain-containing protein [Trueperaceae bacterium]|nr:SIMPL domain-containing protein [Trueperaceae bacterium]